jgi:DNA-binding transcriptional ArsR family regulator
VAHKRYLLDESAGGYSLKEIVIREDPSSFKALLNPVTWKIAKALASKPMYPAEIARELRIHPQTVYYYIRRLVTSGLVTVAKEMNINGATARYYTLSYHGFGVEFPKGGSEVTSIRAEQLDPKVRLFFSPFLNEGTFQGRIVVGSPDPHGPLKTTSRDGHYAVHLAFFLGQLSKIPGDFVVKLDVDVKTEKEEGQNLILIGGPGTNVLSRQINEHLPIKFNEKDLWGGIVDAKGKRYTTDRDAIIATIRNPFAPNKRIIYFAGTRAVGTKSAIIGIANYWDKVLESFEGQDEWAVVVRGFDLDGDGKVDSVDVVS